MEGDENIVYYHVGPEYEEAYRMLIDQDFRSKEQRIEDVFSRLRKTTERLGQLLNHHRDRPMGTYRGRKFQ
jgi:hypothetical protein